MAPQMNAYDPRKKSIKYETPKPKQAHQATKQMENPRKHSKYKSPTKNTLNYIVRRTKEMPRSPNPHLSAVKRQILNVEVGEARRLLLPLLLRLEWRHRYLLPGDYLPVNPGIFAGGGEKRRSRFVSRGNPSVNRKSNVIKNG